MVKNFVLISDTGSITVTDLRLLTLTFLRKMMIFFSSVGLLYWFTSGECWLLTCPTTCTPTWEQTSQFSTSSLLCYRCLRGKYKKDTIPEIEFFFLIVHWLFIFLYVLLFFLILLPHSILFRFTLCKTLFLFTFFFVSH